ncbi:MAG TPA: tetratricopeptide repeat protein [Pyrinomonadaceae bacterium]|nr:tetratricopeptide repeat protein [Pyrinomonadaceae bacterium]
MFTRRVATILATLVLAVSVLAIWSAEGDELDGDTGTNVVAASGAEAGAQTDKPKKKGGGFFKVFKAPFKAVGRLFGKGGDDGKLARMKAGDAERFESVGVVRVQDKTTERARVDETDGSARACLERGRAMLEEGNLNGAIAQLSRAASLDPKLVQAHNLLAVAYDRKGLHDRARDSYDRAVDVNDSDPQALNNLGYSLYISGNYRAAVDKLKRAARLAPGDARIHNNLALAQTRLGKYDDAYKNFARAGGEFSGHTNVAALLIRVGRDDKAASHLEAARRLQPGSTNVLRHLAELYERNGNKAKAEEARLALNAEDAKHAMVASAGGK